MARPGPRVALVGATGAVGAEILTVLDERRFALRELLLYASPDSEGQELEFRGSILKVRPMSGAELARCDLVLWAAKGGIAELLPAVREGHARVIDVSGSLEKNPDVPFFLSGVAAPPREARFVAIPRGVAAGLGLALAPLVREGLVRGASIVTLESASGAGIAGVGELTDHTVQVLNQMTGERADSTVFAQSLAFDSLPQIGALEPNGETEEEASLRTVLRRVLASPALELDATRVRVPTLGGSLAVVHAELTRPLGADAALELWKRQPHVSLLSGEDLPTPRGSLGHDDAAIGRVRAHGVRLAFVVAQNDLRLGGALAAVAAAEALLR
jgi:aspartate-semialdehyde dehydrogenase